MSEKQITALGLTKTGWNRIDELLTRANKEQLRLIMIKIMEKLPEDQITIEYNKKVKP